MKILITGDFCPINRIASLINKEVFGEIYNDFLPLVRKADIAITNLECPITKQVVPVKESGPALRADPNCIEALKFGGFKLVTLANNHILDYGDRGLTDTLNFLKDNDIGYVGAGENNLAARKPYIYLKDGLKVGIISIAENEWSTTHDEKPGAGPIDVIDNSYDIKKTKEIVDVLIVIPHGGHEMYNLPSPAIQKLYRFYINSGADIIVGHHPHCYSGYEVFNGKHIFYSLGNFIFDNIHKRSGDWTQGIAIEISIGSEGIEFQVIPLIQCDDIAGVRLLNNVEKEFFFLYFDKLSKIISDEMHLSHEFDKQVRRLSNKYFGYIQPYSNKYISYLRTKGLFPDIWSKQKKKLLLNLIRCESHRDLLMNLLSK